MVEDARPRRIIRRGIRAHEVEQRPHRRLARVDDLSREHGIGPFGGLDQALDECGRVGRTGRGLLRGRCFRLGRFGRIGSRMIGFHGRQPRDIVRLSGRILRRGRERGKPATAAKRVGRPDSIDPVQRAARRGQGVDAPLDLGVIDQRRGVVRLDPGVDHERAACSPSASGR